MPINLDLDSDPDLDSDLDADSDLDSNLDLNRDRNRNDERMGYAGEAAGLDGRVAIGDRRDRPLRGLAGSSVADRFRAWTGRSGRRYVFSVFRLDAIRENSDGLPTGGSSIVLGVERGDDGTRTLVFVADSGPLPEAFFAGALMRDLRLRRGGEVHVHLTAGDRGERRGIVADLAG